MVTKGFIKAETIFIDAPPIKASANRKKYRKELIQKAARIYDEQLRKQNNDDDSTTDGMIEASTPDPDCGLFHKGEHKVEFAYATHVACNENNFILSCEVTSGNVYDSTVFDTVYDDVINIFQNVETVAVDAGYKTPWICKKVQEDGRNLSIAYKRSMSKKSFFRSYEYVYD